MITDRTAQDVARWKELRDKGWVKMSPAEQSEWMGEMRGRYAHTDMNRVESAVEALSARFVESGYLDTHLTVKTNWNLWSVPTRADMVRYLDNVRTLRELVPTYPTTPKIPEGTPKMDHNLANDIEQILVDLDNILRQIPQGYYYAGEIMAGEV